MGGPSTPDVPHVTNTQMQLYMRYLPQILNATSNAQPGINQTQSQSAMDILRQFGQSAAQQGQQLQGSNNQAGLDQVNKSLTGTGGQNVINADNINRSINPEYYANRSAASKGGTDLINSINLKGLSPGEEAAIERSTNQTNSATGNLGLINPTNTISNAMNFGNAMAGKRQEMSNAVNTNTNLMNSSQSSNFGNVMQGALTQPNSSTGTNFGLASLPLNGSQAFSGGAGLMNSIGQTNSTMQPLLYQNTLANSAQGYAHSVGENVNCCFIFLESFNGRMPWFVRLCRDRYYAQEPQVASGYKQMAKWIVPMMRRNQWVRRIVDILMVKPITAYGGYLYNQNKYGWLCKPFKLAWFSIWRNY